jgi:hypothetical protein
MRKPIELHHVETLLGAACCQSIELQYYKAAPLQDGGYLYIHPARHSRTTTKDEDDSAGFGPAQRNRSFPVPDTSQLAFGPQDVLIRSPTSLVFPLEHVVKLLQIRERRFVVISPGLFLRTLSLETPGSTGFHHPDLSLGSIFVPVYPGMAVMHSL